MNRSPQQIEEELLVLRCQGGDAAAWRPLVAGAQGRMLRLARRLVGDAPTAADCVQEAWVSIARHLGRLDDPARFPAWSLRIVGRKCFDAIRRRERARQREDRWATERFQGEAPDTADEATAHAETRQRLRAALQDLPASARDVLRLHYLDELPVETIATRLELPPGTVKSRLHRARHQLRSVLQPE